MSLLDADAAFLMLLDAISISAERTTPTQYPSGKAYVNQCVAAAAASASAVPSSSFSSLFIIENGRCVG